MRRTLYMVGILAILAGALLAPPEMGWPKELLATILLLWMGGPVQSGGRLQEGLLPGV